MGHALLATAPAHAREVAVVGAVDRQDAPELGLEVASGVVTTADLGRALDLCDVYIDFTTPASTRAAAIAATPRRRAAVIGTTGLAAADDEAIAALVQVAPVVLAANFSLGVNVVLGLARQAARALGPTWDAEVVEIHHHDKRDAPSGTALAIARALASGQGSDYDRVKRHARDGDVGPRPRGEIGVSAVRGGDVVGEHVAYLFGEGERVELAHRATSRTIFAAGALRAAAWVVGKPPGRYDMLDVLGFAS
jgi:4-hydroxy-tetrahydrodipicolinate reductase